MLIIALAVLAALGLAFAVSKCLRKQAVGQVAAVRQDAAAAVAQVARDIAGTPKG